jgi:hypothetical protein
VLSEVTEHKDELLELRRRVRFHAAVRATLPATLLSMSSPLRGSGVKTADKTFMSHSSVEGMLL